jgi:hypothetical protein
LVIAIALSVLIAKLVQNPAGIVFGLFCAPVLVIFLKRARRLHQNACKIVLGSFVAVLVLPGLFATPDLSAASAFKVVEIQSHYSDLLAPGALLAAGRPLFREVTADYGVVQPICLAAIIKTLRTSFSFGIYVEIVRTFSALFLLLAACLFYRAAGKAKIASLFAIAFFAPLMQPNQMNEYFPNQTAWRLIGFPIAVLFSAVCRLSFYCSILKPAFA